MSDITLPRANQALINPKDGPQGSAGTATHEFYNFLRQLASITTNVELQEEINGILIRLDALEESDSFTIQGQLSVAVTGTPSGGLVALALRNDVSSPAAGFYYGTNEFGVKGWYARLLTTLNDVDTTTPFVAGDAPVFDGSLFQPTPVLANPMTSLGDIIVADVGGVPDRLGVGADGDVLTIVAGVPAYAAPATGGHTRGITVTGGSIGGSVITAAQTIGGLAASDYTLTGNWYLWCSPTGSIEVDVRKTTFGALPPGPGDSICGGNEPSVAAAISDSGTFAGWSTSISRDDALSVVVNSVTDVTWFVLLLEAV